MDILEKLRAIALDLGYDWQTVAPLRVEHLLVLQSFESAKRCASRPAGSVQ